MLGFDVLFFCPVSLVSLDIEITEHYNEERCEEHHNKCIYNWVIAFYKQKLSGMNEGRDKLCHLKSLKLKINQ